MYSVVIMDGSTSDVKSITSADRSSQKSLGQGSDYVKGSMTSFEASLAVINVRRYGWLCFRQVLLSVQKAEAKIEKNTFCQKLKKKKDIKRTYARCNIQ